MKNRIPIRNIYYMLVYAFKYLSCNEFKKINAEQFENIEEMFAEILDIGIRRILKENLVRDYNITKDKLSLIRGKIDISESINSLSFINNKLVCEFDEYEINSYLNQIIKSTLKILLKCPLDKKRISSLKKFMPYFSKVDTINVNSINWNINFKNISKAYRIVIGICYLFIHGCIESMEAGNIKLMDFQDSQLMSSLYEKFILEYYKKHFPEYNPASKIIEWQLDTQNNYLLPVMKTDIMMNNGSRYLIIDAKYYQESLQHNFKNDTAISNHLYQIFSYVKNKDFELRTITYEVSGILLYAKTDDEVQPKSDFCMSGNRISIDYLDLDCSFEKIKEKLNSLINKFLEN